MKQPVKFAGKEIPDFVKVTGRTMTLLPEISVNYKELPAQIGGFYSRTKLGTRKTELEIMLIPEHPSTLDEKMAEFAEWLQGDDFKPSQLTFADQQDRYLLAQVSGSTDIDDLFFAGKGKITFLSVNPIFYLFSGLNKTEGAPISVNYTGQIPQAPVITFTVAKACKRIELYSNRQDGRIILSGNFSAGNSIQIDCDNKVIKVNNQVNMKVMTVESDWLLLQKGKNILTLKLDNTTAVNNITVASKIAMYR